jgi:putative RecB family exonuclease
MTLLLTPTPTDVALELTGRNYLSYSAISTFQACPLRYYFRYLQGLPEPFVSASLVFGSAIHAAIEMHYREQLRGVKKPAFELLQQVYREKWTHYGSQTIRFGKEEDRRSLDNLSDRVLTTFQSSDLAQRSGRILAIEEELRSELIPGCPAILARVDLVVDTGPAVILTDFKTSRARWSQEQVEESSSQLLLYHDLVQTLADGRPVHLEFAVISKTKVPTLTRYPVRVDVRQIERTKRIVRRVWTAIQTGVFYPSPSPLNCSNCPFRDPCREWLA